MQWASGAAACFSPLSHCFCSLAIHMSLVPRGPNRPKHTEAAMNGLGLMVRVFLHRFRASPALNTIACVPAISVKPHIFMNKHAGRILATGTPADNDNRDAWMQHDSIARWCP